MTPHGTRLLVHLAIFLVGSLACYGIAAGIVWGTHVALEGLGR